MWEPTGKLLIAYTMYNSTRCYGIPYTYTVVSLCDRCFRVAVRGKGIILTSTTQNKLEIKILLTVKSSMTSILSVWEHLNLLWKSTGQRNILWEIPDQPSLRPLLLLQLPSFGIARSLSSEAEGFSHENFPYWLLFLWLETTAYRNIIWVANRNSSLSFLQEAKNRT